MNGGLLGPGSAIRTRIALVHGGVFLVLGAILLLLVNVLVRAGTHGEADEIVARADAVVVVQADRLGDDISRAAGEQMLMWSGLALLVVACVAVVVGWWTAGRVLRPVHEMTARARRLSEHTHHVGVPPDGAWGRLAVRGPDDELKELGDTLDAFLGRLETAFDSRRLFVANASHELRTPLAVQRAAIQIGLDDSCEVRELLLDTNRRSERLIDGLLLLARGERGLPEREDVPLGDVVTEEYPDARVVAGGGTVRGNRVLLGQLVRNLVANAVTHNVPGGLVDVRVEAGVLTVLNTGPVVRAADVECLFEPFRRGAGRDRTGPGAGLGLSIVRSIAVAHDGAVTAVARDADDGGGLVVTVTLPVAATTSGGQSSRPASSPR
ncbi:sensor histidine kinase [Streptomyces sp. NPDC048330]|uniref:sensor histidine kinase n=1 Tax=Streptomyces sp. NPDC048330 TaxID=3365533 RepID=UPI0037219F96